MRVVKNEKQLHKLALTLDSSDLKKTLLSNGNGKVAKHTPAAALRNKVHRHLGRPALVVSRSEGYRGWGWGTVSNNQHQELAKASRRFSSGRRLLPIPVGHHAQVGGSSHRDESLGLSVQNVRVRLGQAESKWTRHSHGARSLHSRKRGTAAIGHQGTPEADCPRCNADRYGSNWTAFRKARRSAAAD